MASYAPPDIFELMGSETLDSLHGSQPAPKRRKVSHDDDSTGNMPSRTINIRPHAASVSEKPITLKPVAILPRSRLPLTWLENFSFPSSQIQQSGHLFVSDIPALDNCLRDEDLEPTTTVLVARSVHDNSSSRLYVIEKVKERIYSLSGLGHWVHEDDVFVASKKWQGVQSLTGSTTDEPVSSSSTITTTGPGRRRKNGLDWLQIARIDDPVPDSCLSTKRSKFDVSVVFGVDPPGAIIGAYNNDGGSGIDANFPAHPSPLGSVGQPVASISSTTMERRSSADTRTPTIVPREQSDNVDLSTDASCGSDSSKVDNGLQSPQEVLDGLREQYLQALYITKTSLAYFAKGPLARCRAAFQSKDQETSNKPIDLLEFYREAILNAKKMDLKYRETLPSTIRNVLLSVSDDETVSQTKRRKSRKKKLGKNGLYPEEEGYVHKWWKNRSLVELSTSTQMNREADAKKHVADLRLRETQLQILLILEAMFLESISLGRTKEDGEEKTVTKKSKSKKPQDLNVLLELHLDRLCIWHAVSSEEAVVTDSVKAQDGNHLAGKKVESDVVRDFCTEVIIPYYASRLPEKCKLITRKFGISGAASSPRNSSKSSHSRVSSRPEPGSVVKRQQQPQSQQPRQQQEKQEEPQKSRRRTLQRVLTDEKAASQKKLLHPSLTRSSTEPSQQDAKRESIEPLLPSLKSGVRGGIQKPKRADNREVDLNASAKQHENKLKKMQILVEQKKELDVAISTLRRPNREFVAKDIANDVDKRLSSGGGSSRKPKNPVRNPLGHGVQVMATPKRSRKKDTGVGVGVPLFPRRLAQMSTTETPSSLKLAEPDEPSSPSGSDAWVVPSSSLRPGASYNQVGPSGPVPSGGIFGSDTNQGDNVGTGAIQETPCRRPTPRPISLGRDRIPLGEGGVNIGHHSGSGHSDRNFYRVSNLPAVTAASSSVSTSVGGHGHDYANANASLAVKETPLSKKGQGQDRGHSPPAVLTTPVKGASSRRPKTSDMSEGVVMPETPEKSIYKQLGWDAEEDEVLGT